MFTTVCRHGSFSQAAEELNIVQPALSRQIANLEMELGATLADRSSRPIRPTPTGQFLLDRAQHILDSVERLKFELAAKLKQHETTVTIGFVGSALASELPGYLRALRQRDPDIKLELQEMTSAAQWEALKEGRITAGFGRIFVDDPMIEQIVVKNDPLVVALPLGHALLASQGAIDPASLTEEQVVLYPVGVGSNYADRVLSELKRRGTTLRRVFQVSDLNCALGLVAANAGLSIVPCTAQGNHPGEIVFREIRGEPLVSPIIINIRREDRSKELRLLLEAANVDAPTP